MVEGEPSGSFPVDGELRQHGGGVEPQEDGGWACRIPRTVVFCCIETRPGVIHGDRHTYGMYVCVWVSYRAATFGKSALCVTTKALFFAPEEKSPVHDGVEDTKL